MRLRSYLELRYNCKFCTKNLLKDNSLPLFFLGFLTLLFLFTHLKLQICRHLGLLGSRLNVFPQVPLSGILGKWGGAAAEKGSASSGWVSVNHGVLQGFHMDCKVLTHEEAGRSACSSWGLLNIRNYCLKRCRCGSISFSPSKWGRDCLWQPQSHTALVPQGRQWHGGGAGFRIGNYNAYIVNSTWKFTNGFYN